MGVCDVPLVSKVCDFAGDAAGAVVSAPFEWLAEAMGETAGWMFEGVWEIFDTTTLVDVTSSEYVEVYNILFGIGVMLALLFFCIQLITGLIRRDPGSLQRAALGLARAILGSFLVITLTAGALEIVDQLCIGIVQATGNSMEEMGGRIAALATGLTAINAASPGVGAIITIFLAGLAISAAAIVWFSLLIRKALLLVAIVLAPIALSGQGWDAAKGWFSKWAAFVIALIVSKLVLVVIFLVAISQVSAPIDFDLASLSDPIAGIVLMFVAAFAPYMTYKFISFAGFDTYHTMTAEHEAKNAMNRPVPIPASPRAGHPARVLYGNQGTGIGPTESSQKAEPPAKARPTKMSSSDASSGNASSGSPQAGGDGKAGGRTDTASVSDGSITKSAGGGAAGAGVAVAKGAVTSGRRAGTTVGGATESTTDDAQRAETEPPPSPPPTTAFPPKPQS